MHADFGLQLYSVPSITLVRLASGLTEQCFKKQSGLAGSRFGGCMALDLHLSRVRTGVAAMGQYFFLKRTTSLRTANPYMAGFLKLGPGD